MKFKVCGLNHLENITAIEAIQELSYSGFIFVEKSPRHALALTKLPNKPKHIQRVGVFVNADFATIQALHKEFELDIIQLHGNETPEFCQEVQTQLAPVYKAIGIKQQADLKPLNVYHRKVNAFVFDTKSAKHGGTGQKFDWNILTYYKGPTPFLLGGGIAPNDVKLITRFSHPFCMGFDLNSRFEEQPGIKNLDQLNDFINQLKNDTQQTI